MCLPFTHINYSSIDFLSAYIILLCTATYMGHNADLKSMILLCWRDSEIEIWKKFYFSFDGTWGVEEDFSQIHISNEF